ncbi:uncharacterized protein LOC133289949 [Gastrolobium bilobum]|uniref:uncharacterized protein LOC133289949 n=1 Tax=Gastrolobium bilobum TaxID=150636 RepID=UPI002AB1B16E|nr:uncharacterized protein LOC133289949 [Gastrolobium bilobum]
MGLLSWWKGKKSQPESEAKSQIKNTNATAKPTTAGAEVPGMNGAMEVPRPPNTNVSVFEFGASNDKVTLAGYCPVSEDLQPCRWEILPAIGSNAPQFRVVF